MSGLSLRATEILIVDVSTATRKENNYGVKSYTKDTAQAHLSEAMNCGYLGLQSKTKLNNTFESKFVEVDNDQCFGVNILNNQTLPQDAVLQVMTNNGVSYAILLRPPLAIFDGWSESQIGTARKNAEKSSTSTDDNGLKNVIQVAGRLSLFNGSGRQSRLPESRVDTEKSKALDDKSVRLGRKLYPNGSQTHRTHVAMGHTYIHARAACNQIYNRSMYSSSNHTFSSIISTPANIYICDLFLYRSSEGFNRAEVETLRSVFENECQACVLSCLYINQDCGRVLGAS